MKKIGLYILTAVFAAASGTIAASALISLRDVSENTRTEVTKEHAKENAVKAIRGNIADEYEITDMKGRTKSFGFLIRNTKGDLFEVNVDAAKGNVFKINKLRSDEVLENELAPLG